MRSFGGDLKSNEDFDSLKIDSIYDADPLALDYDRGRIKGEFKTKVTHLKKQVKLLKKMFALSIFDSKEDMKELFSDI